MSETKNFEWEAIIQTIKNDSIRIDKKGIDTPKSNESSAIIARAILGNKQGISISSDSKNMKESLLQAKSIAKIMPDFEQMPKILSTEKFKKKTLTYKNFTEKKLIDSAQEIRNIAEAKAPLISLSLSKIIYNTTYINSLGARIELKKDAIAQSLSIGKGDRTGSNFSILNEKKFSPQSFCRHALMQYENSKKAAKPSQGNYPVIFCNSAAESILSPILFSLQADNVCEKKSRYQEAMQKKELSKDLTIIDNPHEKNNKAYYDCEANKAKKTILVQNGIINSFIHDSFTSKKLKMKNTHNSASTSIKPSTSYHCVQIKGKDKLSQMIKSTKNGFIAYDTYPEHTINKITGAFGQNSSTLYHIKNGEIQGLCKGYVITGNSYELFKQDLEISKETRNDLASNVGAIKAKATILKN
ncbi:MAG: TldD/PmbA family protein [Candidatus Nanoarchaeia archaeon]|nr:TldD/PmbA family protein [Candidatus Nanoarchaeia archaeon]